MLYDQFDALLPEAKQELTAGKAALFPAYLRDEIEEMNEWVYNTVNNGEGRLCTLLSPWADIGIEARTKLVSPPHR